MSRKRKEKPIAPGDAVTVLRQCADGGARMARGVVRFAAQGGRFLWWMWSLRRARSGMKRSGCGRRSGRRM